MVVVALLSGCGSSSPSDKAGNDVDRSPTVLTLANGLGGPHELQAFVDEVAKRSGGTIRIRIVNEWRSGQLDYEQGLVRDVTAGRADLGAVASLAWRALGVDSFDALNAPFVLDSYSLEGAVLESDVPKAMLRSIESLGVEGIGILPGPLHYLLSTPRPLLRPEDFERLRIGHQRGPARDTLLALGATPVVLPDSASWRGIDAIETQIASIATTGYFDYATHLTANVPLWPRPLVLFANARAMARLSAAQRSLLRDAARAAIAGALQITQAHEREAMSAACRRGLDPAHASDRDRAALRAAVAPVLDGLRGEPHTRDVLKAIDTLRERTGPGPALTCPGQAGAAAPTLPDGTYTTRVTLADIRASGADRVLNAAETRDFVRSTFSLVLDHSGFVLYTAPPGRRRLLVFEGTFSVHRDRFVATGTNGDVVRARFSIDGTSLGFRDVSAVEDLVAVWQSRPWRRVR